MQAGDVPITYADTTPLEKDFGFKPHTSLRDGLRNFAIWYKKFYMEKWISSFYIINRSISED